MECRQDWGGGEEEREASSILHRIPWVMLRAMELLSTVAYVAGEEGRESQGCRGIGEQGPTVDSAIEGDAKQAAKGAAQRRTPVLVRDDYMPGNRPHPSQGGRRAGVISSCAPRLACNPLKQNGRATQPRGEGPPSYDRFTLGRQRCSLPCRDHQPTKESKTKHFLLGPPETGRSW